MASMTAVSGSKPLLGWLHTYFRGVLSLFGMIDAQVKPILLCSCNDNSVRLYDLPTFSERGKIFSKEEVRAMQVGPGGLFFTGDATDCVYVGRRTQGLRARKLQSRRKLPLEIR
ncbi:zinc finger CCCH domain-containing protein [Musa troglodytarum]|uniref:Zinc finger CCCH domain-containing protein n=1 Tax=Musa troglodytarum TaxID=320322 RepID=A0A9E7FSY8_9LILI|nr:zinc finger CCCH domain-containing protein [Musa troglodytarum]